MKATAGPIYQAHDHTLLPTVKAVSEYYMKAGLKVALTIAFLTALDIAIGMQIVDNLNRPTLRGTLCWFLYSSIFFNLVAAVCGLAFVHYVSRLPSSAEAPCCVKDHIGNQLGSETYNTSLPGGTGHVRPASIDQDFELMRQFGLKKYMRSMWNVLSWTPYVGSADEEGIAPRPQPISSLPKKINLNFEEGKIEPETMILCTILGVRTTQGVRCNGSTCDVNQPTVAQTPVSGG
ncbi:hypothetical protein M408DRAFT_9010 [Serendipita vermifera MAFF 305830]|uniref:Uncharacterized protein n=1 Tax=Serendipita vermifera MAFF 305830 TaxID=933852 RepID=A0A0C2XGA9_SERVB|nr:hypothetical protein M408DRAFT_9010 [Serendipita vermifera MAFF 305830]